MLLFPDHVAVLVERLECALVRIQELGLAIGPVEEFPGEGTREVYVGADAQSARLLLIQPLGDGGPYARAMGKRGPGLHHIAVSLPEPRACAARLPGWLVHPASLGDQGDALWLARPGVPCLLELGTGRVKREAPVVERIELPVTSGLEALLDPLGDVDVSNDGGVWLTMLGQRLVIESLIAG